MSITRKGTYEVRAFFVKDKRRYNVLYWVLSPNIGLSGGTVLQGWKERIVEYKAAYMGWSPAPEEDGEMGLGRKFAKKYGSQEIAVLIAYREDWEWKMVACGKVASEAKRDDGALAKKYGEEYRYGSYRLRRPFIPLVENPRLGGLSFKGTSPDRRRNVPTLVELKPEANPKDRRLCDRLTAIIRGAEREAATSRRPKARPQPGHAALRTMWERDAALDVQEARAGYQADPLVRRTVEKHAMERAKRHYSGAGYRCEDTSKNHPFDLECRKGESLIYVEVKGTQNSGEEIILTEGELRHMKANRQQSQLFLLSQIDVDQGRVPKAGGGGERIISADRILNAARQPTQYRVVLPT